jgi:hypothetical protein
MPASDSGPTVLVQGPSSCTWLQPRWQGECVLYRMCSDVSLYLATASLAGGSRNLPSSRSGFSMTSFESSSSRHVRAIPSAVLSLPPPLQACALPASNIIAPSTLRPLSLAYCCTLQRTHSFPYQLCSWLLLHTHRYTVSIV